MSAGWTLEIIMVGFPFSFHAITNFRSSLQALASPHFIRSLRRASEGRCFLILSCAICCRVRLCPMLLYCWQVEHPEYFLKSVLGKCIMKKWDVTFPGTPPVIFNVRALDYSHIYYDCQDHFYLNHSCCFPFIPSTLWG